MRVYKQHPHEGIEIVNADGTEALRMLLRELDGTPMGADWPTPSVK